MFICIYFTYIWFYIYIHNEKESKKGRCYNKHHIILRNHQSYYQNVYAKKSENLEERDTFLDIYNFLGSTTGNRTQEKSNYWQGNQKSPLKSKKTWVYFKEGLLLFCLWLIQKRKQTRKPGILPNIFCKAKITLIWKVETSLQK